MSLSEKDEHRFYCHLDGCYNVRRASILCTGHEVQLREGRQLTVVKNQHMEPWDFPICNGPECDRPAVRVKRTYCAAHAEQINRGEELRKLRKFTQQVAGICIASKCDRPKKTNDLCTTHYSQFWKYGQTWELNERFECAVPHCDRVYTRLARGTLCKIHKTTATKYGLTEDQFVSLSAQRECHICGEEPSRALHIDHDHSCCSGGNEKKCGRCVRGLLCMHCNHLIGNAKEDPKILQAAIDYLARVSLRDALPAGHRE